MGMGCLAVTFHHLAFSERGCREVGRFAAGQRYQQPPRAPFARFPRQGVSHIGLNPQNCQDCWKLKVLQRIKPVGCRIERRSNWMQFGSRIMQNLSFD